MFWDPKKNHPFIKNKEQENGQMSIIRLMILEKAFGLPEKSRTFPFPKAGSCSFYHHTKTEELHYKGTGPPAWVHSLWKYQCLRDKQDTEWTLSLSMVTDIRDRKARRDNSQQKLNIRALYTKWSTPYFDMCGGSQTYPYNLQWMITMLKTLCPLVLSTSTGFPFRGEASGKQTYTMLKKAMPAIPLLINLIFIPKY